MPPDIDEGGRSVTSQIAGGSVAVKKFGDYGLSEWQSYFATEEGRAYIESMHALISHMFSWGLGVSDTLLGHGEIDPKRSAALTFLVNAGHIEVSERQHLFTGDGVSRIFVRRMF